MRQRAGAGQLQELAGGRRGLLPTKELYGGPPGLPLASGPSPFATCTVGGPGTIYVNAEVEPWVAVNPVNPLNIAVPTRTLIPYSFPHTRIIEAVPVDIAFPKPRITQDKGKKKS